jgi:hypothetical protein
VADRKVLIQNPLNLIELPRRRAEYTIRQFN